MSLNDITRCSWLASLQGYKVVVLTRLVLLYYLFSQMFSFKERHRETMQQMEVSNTHIYIICDNDIVLKSWGSSGKLVSWVYSNTVLKYYPFIVIAMRAMCVHPPPPTPFCFYVSMQKLSRAVVCLFLQIIHCAGNQSDFFIIPELCWTFATKHRTATGTTLRKH